MRMMDSRDEMPGYFQDYLVYKGQLKSSQADQDTFMECDQIKFIFQHSFSCVYNFSISFAMLGSHWSKKSTTVDMTPSYKLFIQLIFQPTPSIILNED